MPTKAEVLGRTSFPSAAGLLFLALFAGPTALLGEEGAGGDEHAHHRHHMAAPGAERTEAIYSVPAVDLIDQQGRERSIQAVLDTGKPVLLNFIFTTCTAICPVMSATFEQVQRKLGDEADEVVMVSVSIDPEQDTPAALADYAKRFNAGPQWVFLTGSLEDSIAVQKAFDAYRGDKMNHAPLTLLRAGPDTQWVRYDGFASAADLVKETRVMFVD